MTSTIGGLIIALMTLLGLSWIYVWQHDGTDHVEHALYVKMKAEVQGLREDLREAKELGCLKE
jgi:hypothetical protein